MMQNSLKIAVLGAGSIGCYLGGQLAKGGAHITFIGRERFQKQLNENGLTLTHFAREPIHIPAEGFEFAVSPEAVKGADIILVCVKSQDSLEAAKSIKSHVDADAIIISFQNGVGNPDIIQSELPDHVILGGVVPFNVTGTDPGCFHSGTEGDLMAQAHDDPRMGRVVSVFKGGGQTLELVADMKALQWGKLLINLNNALNTLTGGTLHEGLSQRDYRRAFAAMLEEGLNVVKCAGIEPENFGKTSTEMTIKIMRLPNFLFRQVMKRNIKIDKKARSSMLDDLEMGRGTEIEYLQGEIVNLAAVTDQSAPINQIIMNAVKTAFSNGVSPKLSGKEIWNLCRQK